MICQLPIIFFFPALLVFYGSSSIVTENYSAIRAIRALKALRALLVRPQHFPLIFPFLLLHPHICCCGEIGTCYGLGVQYSYCSFESNIQASYYSTSNSTVEI